MSNCQINETEQQSTNIAIRNLNENANLAQRGKLASHKQQNDVEIEPVTELQR